MAVLDHVSRHALGWAHPINACGGTCPQTKRCLPSSPALLKIPFAVLGHNMSQHAHHRSGSRCARRPTWAPDATTPQHARCLTKICSQTSTSARPTWAVDAQKRRDSSSLFGHHPAIRRVMWACTGLMMRSSSIILDLDPAHREMHPEIGSRKPCTYLTQGPQTREVDLVRKSLLERLAETLREDSHPAEPMYRRRSTTLPRGTRCIGSRWSFSTGAAHGASTWSARRTATHMHVSRRSSKPLVSQDFRRRIATKRRQPAERRSLQHRGPITDLGHADHIHRNLDLDGVVLLHLANGARISRALPECQRVTTGHGTSLEALPTH